MIEKITEYLGSNNELTGSMVGFLLKPENLERLKNNKKLVKKLTKIKALPSSVRLYLRNLAGVTDKITEDFFSKSELSEIKKRVAKAEAEGSMGNNAVSGLTTRGTGRTNIIGYELDKGKLSFAKAFTDPATNIDMTLGQATFSKDDEGNFIVKDKHNFGADVGGGTLYDNKEYFEGRKENTKVIPHLDRNERLDLDFPSKEREDKEWLESFKKMMPNEAESYTQYESDKQILERAKNAFEDGDIDASKYARIVAGFQQGEEIPVELNLGTITQEDKLQITTLKTKPFDFWNESKIIEFKKRNCEHNRFPDFILQEDKLRVNIETAKKYNITFLYQNKFSNGKIWEWNISKMEKENSLPEPIVKEMNHYTYVNDQKKVPKSVYMLTLDMGYEI